MNKLSAKGKLWKQCILVYCDRDVMYRCVSHSHPILFELN